ncbi:hypothetical protein DFH28DRAFT_16453 [Melampsora americana]|nr:hypothetical protein DFH28DRAFT_16453 [Melampsora americana]
MGVQRKKATRSERRAQPMPKLDTLPCASVDPEFVTGNSSRGQNSSSVSAPQAKPKPLRPLTSKQRLKRERGAELAAKLEVKASRKVIRQNNRTGAKKIYT